MDNQDKTTFSLDDDEIVEEEVIERDEEYDDGEDYDDEEYDDEEYDDEEYDDEGEDYGDEEEYYDEDDGYNDDYYDDRLNKVLDEIAELKRSMVPAAVQQQPQQQQVMPPYMPPQYIYQPMPQQVPPSAGSEVVMYNEISRLRDELAKNQSNLEMQKELSRLKDDMARDQKFAESQYNAEIQRLQSRIDDLLKNGSSPQGELAAPQEQARVEGANSNAALDLDRLLSINEAVLRATRDSDSRIQNEIGLLKKQLDEIPSLKELNNAISAVKKATSNAEGMNSDILTKLVNDVAELRTAIEERGSMPPAQSATPVVSNHDSSSCNVSASELLRQLYEIKAILGNSSEAAVKRTQVLSDLVNEFKKVNFDVHSQSTLYKDKLVSVYGYARKLVESNEQETIDLIIAINDIISELAAQPLTRSTFADIVSYSSEYSEISVTSSVRDSAERFFNIKDKLANVKVTAYPDYLTDINAAINGLQNNHFSAENNKTLNKILAAIREENHDEDDIKTMVARFIGLNVGDVVDLPKIDLPKTYTPEQATEGDNIFSKLAELKAAVLDGISNSAKQPVEQAVVADEEPNPVAQAAQAAQTAAQAAAHDDARIQEILSSMEDLKSKLATTDMADLTGALEEIRGNYIDMSNRLVDISEKIQQPVSVELDSASSAMSDADRQQALDDLSYIRAKLDEHEEFINQISDLRAEIINIGNSIDLTEPLAEQVNALISEINTQFDKLYEDLSGVFIESEANIVNRMGDSNAEVNPGEAVELAKADILADTQAIKDSLLTISDSIFLLPITDTLDAVRNEILADTQAIKDTLLNNSNDNAGSQVLSDAIEQLRADVAAFADVNAANADAAAIDRQKLLDDIAFLREQAETAISEAEAEQGVGESDAVASDGDKITAYLDDISARVSALTAVADDIASTKETVGVIGDNINVISDNIMTVADNMTTINDNITAVGEGVTALTDSVQPLAGDVAAAREAAAAALDALAPISEQLNALLDRFDAQEQSSVYDDGEVAAEGEGPMGAAGVMSDEELVELKDSLNTILDTLPLFPQADDVVATRDNTYAILDSLALMPQTDDVTITRDNVAAVLDIVTALSDSLDAALAAQDNGQLAEDVAALRETVEGTVEDVKFIREKLEEAPQSEEQVEDLSNIMQDIGLVLDKLEDYERTAAANKQEIIDAVDGIREEMHINTLDENMSAAGIDSETRDALVGEIAEIRERLGNIESNAQAVNEMNSASLDGINSQLAELQASLEERLTDMGQSTMASDDAEVSGDNMQAIIDELASIREKLDAGAEYDTVEEILSLREDIKAARIVDQDEVTGELEAIKNELAAISSGNILDEIRALREDIVNLPSADGASAPTDGEINLVLNEIVSLRDEVFAFKDEVLNATTAGEPQEEQQEQAVGADDDVNAILDELAALRDDQNALTDNIDELKDIISRRTTLSVAEGEEQDASANAVGGLDVVLDEIINLKNDIDRIEESVGGDRLNALSEQVDEIRAIIDELRGVENTTEEATEQSVSVDLTPIMEQFDAVNAALDDIRLNRETATLTGEENAVPDTISGRFDELHNEIEDIKSIIEVIAPQDYTTELAELRAEIDALREENEQLKQANADTIGAELAELKDAIREMTLTAAPVATADGDSSYAALIEEIRGLKEQMLAQQPVAATATLDEDTLQAIRDALTMQPQVEQQELGTELAEIRDEIAQLRSLTAVSSESGSAAEVAAMRDELAELKEMLAASDGMMGVAEDLTSIKADVQTLKEEPDLGVMNEILALRDEFQALREQIEDVKRIAGETDREADDTLMNEVQSLRDQLFAISMANVNDPSSGETNYESYNNIILDEIASLRDQVGTAGSAVDLSAVTEEFEELKATLDKRERLYDALAERIAKLNNDATNNKILEELSSLRTDMANQRDADLTTLNFMSEMAHLLERQNQYLTQNAGSKITDEIESLKAEIASSDAVAEEVAKLREIMTQSGSSSDNETILNELADLREELSREKPSRENALILDAIARLRDEITVIAEHEKIRDESSDADLSDSLSDLKEQLNEIAGIVEPAEKKQSTAKATATEKSASGAKRGRKPAAKKSTSTANKSKSAANKPATATKSAGGAKRGRKPAQKVTEAETTAGPITAAIKEPETVELDARIDEQVSNLTGGADGMSLNIQDVNISTGDALDVADKLAKQVANKLIMEQLVEQLGDGGVSEDRVNEILRDILPQEFTTIAETEASDKVRRLANQLVLDKLRARLNGSRNGDKD